MYMLYIVTKVQLSLRIHVIARVSFLRDTRDFFGLALRSELQKNPCSMPIRSKKRIYSVKNPDLI
jgi:hypothetical protein